MNQSYKWHLNNVDGMKIAMFLIHGLVGVFLTNLTVIVLNTDFTVTYHGASYMLTPYVVAGWSLLSKIAWQWYRGPQTPQPAVEPVTELAEKLVVVQPVQPATVEPVVAQPAVTQPVVEQPVQPAV